MDRATRCLHCGKKTVLIPSVHGRSELKCVACDLDPPKMEATARVERPLPSAFGSPLHIRRT